MATSYTTDNGKLQMFTHQIILDIGERIKQKYENIAEYDKQRAIRATEEVIRREEKQIHQQLMEEAKDQWKIEKDQLMAEFEKEKQKCILLEKAALESKLMRDYENRLEMLQHSHNEKLKETVSKTWSQAEIIKDKIVNDAREEEKQLALEIATQTAHKFEQEKQEMEILFEQLKEKALQDQRKLLETESNTKQHLMEQEFQLTYERKLTEICNNYNSELKVYQQLLDDKNKESKNIMEKVDEIKLERDEWKSKYENLKAEFSNFIEQFPGFNADFLLQ